MPAGEGKGWAKGRSALDDPRIARASAARTGTIYTPRVPWEADRRRRSPTVQPLWTAKLAYAVGLIATDGGINRGRTLGFPSADRELVRHLLSCLGKKNKISTQRTRGGSIVYRTQIGDVSFCRWLMTIGVGSRKSLTIGAIKVPRAHLFPLVRGLLDGDGSVMNKMARADVGRRDDYYWEYLQTRFVSASRTHVEWLKGMLDKALGINGLIITRAARGRRHACYTLRYSKRDSELLLPALYRDTSAPRLSRKWRVWAKYRERHRL